MLDNVNLTQAQKTLFQLIGQELFSAPIEICNDVNWYTVVQESMIHGVILLAFKNHNTLPLDKETVAYLQKCSRKCTLGNMNCFNGHQYLNELMTKNNIPYCFLKGVASARYYPDPFLRSMGDVDFYIPPEHVARAREVLSADGFKWEDNDHPHHFGLKKETMYMELHFAPIAIPNDSMRPIFLEYWSDICDKATKISDGLFEYVMPSDFHHGFILLTHLQSHMIRSGIGLRHVCDWAVFANSFSNEDFIAIFEKKLKRAGVWRLAQILALMSVKYFGMPYKIWMGEDYATADALIEEIIRRGNLGRHEKGQGYETLFIADNSVISTNKPRCIRVFLSLNMIIRQHWKAAKKCPLLYPVGWIYFSSRFLFRMMRGKRKADFVSSYKKSGKRIKLYNSLKLFVPEE